VNEKLQQVFIEKTIKQEQEEYAREVRGRNPHFLLLFRVHMRRVNVMPLCSAVLRCDVRCWV
jgi:hypothetical protein